MSTPSAPRLIRCKREGGTLDAAQLRALGGPGDLLERPDAHLPRAPVQQAVFAAGATGLVAAVDVRALGQVVVDLGGGRSRPDQALDHAVGLARVLGRGEAVDAGQPLAIIHARDEGAANAAAERVRRAFRIEAGVPPAVPLWQWYASHEDAA